MISSYVVVNKQFMSSYGECCLRFWEISGHMLVAVYLHKCVCVIEYYTAVDVMMRE